MLYKCGLNYIVVIVVEFDEYFNDVFYIYEGLCLFRYCFVCLWREVFYKFDSILMIVFC